jgi:single-stranded-DNA-specific exonuclease
MICIDRHTSSKDIIALLLKNRRISPDKTSEFLSPTPPYKLSAKSFGISQKQLDQAVNQIKQAIKDNQNILIYGDYDVDGISATAILWQALYALGAKVTPFVPDRELDGYGIKSESFFRFQQQKKTHFDLLITVDNGIVAHDQLKPILAAGTQIIVIDHHTADSKLPAPITTVHSTKISGSGLSWLVASQIYSQADLGLAALGTVADCLPLIDINRSLVFHGLSSLRLNPNFGIKKLISVSGVKPDSISTYDLGFVLGPRINAIGRLSNPTDALRLLCSQNPVQAGKFAQILNDYNYERQQIQQQSLLIADDLVKKNRHKLIFIADPSFHPGIIGLIAGRLTEKYYLPSVVISQTGDISKGSCRSIKELNIIDSLRQLPHLFISLGGHSGAAGFSLATSNIPQLKRDLTKIIDQKLSGKILKPEKFIDAEMKLNAVTTTNCRLISRLEPFGLGNPEPVFLFKQVKVLDKRLLGSAKNHLKLKVDDPATAKPENIALDCIAFKKGDWDKKINIGDLIDFTASLSLNTWNGRTFPQLVVKEILQ